MSLPQKKRGFRKIAIDGRQFNWRFNSQIEICPVSSKDNKLVVDFGWFDAWLFVNDESSRPPDYNPKIVTPAFAREAIEFGLSQHWDVEQKVGVTEIIYRDNQFIKGTREKQ